MLKRKHTQKKTPNECPFPEDTLPATKIKLSTKPTQAEQSDPNYSFSPLNKTL